MSDTERLEAELAIARLVEQDAAARERAYAPGATREDIAAFKALNAEIAAARTAFKTQFPPSAPGPGDAAPNPNSVAGSSTVQEV